MHTQISTCLLSKRVPGVNLQYPACEQVSHTESIARQDTNPEPFNGDKSVCHYTTGRPNPRSSTFRRNFEAQNCSVGGRHQNTVGFFYFLGGFGVTMAEFSVDRFTSFQSQTLDRGVVQYRSEILHNSEQCVVSCDATDIGLMHHVAEKLELTHLSVHRQTCKEMKTISRQVLSDRVQIKGCYLPAKQLQWS